MKNTGHWKVQNYISILRLGFQKVIWETLFPLFSTYRRALQYRNTSMTIKNIEAFSVLIDN